MNRKQPILLAVIILFVFAPLSFAQSQPPTPTPLKTSKEQQNKSTPRQAQSQGQQRGTDDLPLVVKIVKTPAPNTIQSDDTETSSKKSPTEWWKILFDAMLVIFTGALAWFTIKLSRSTEKLWKTAQDQSSDMKYSIAQAERSANAMQDVARSMRENVARMKEVAIRQEQFGKMQLRAYVSVRLLEWVPQDRTNDYRYEIRMIMTNTGHTPAHKISFAIRVAVMDFPLPTEIDLSLPTGESTGHMTSGQQFTISNWLPNLLSDDEVKEITGGRKRMYVFGTVWYQDVFGDDHYTNFCQWASWDVAGKMKTINISRHNDAT